MTLVVRPRVQLTKIRSNYLGHRYHILYIKFAIYFLLYIPLPYTVRSDDSNHSRLDAVRLSRILKAKQKLGRTFNSDKLGGFAFTKISKLTMCSA